MAVYMVILAEIQDMQSFRKYGERAAELVTKFGGEYIARGATDTECLEGDWPDETKVVISKWPSMDAARTFWHSPEYAEAKKLREGNSTVRVRLIEVP